MRTNLAESVVMIPRRRFIVQKEDRVMFRKWGLVKICERQPILDYITNINLSTLNTELENVEEKEIVGARKSIARKYIMTI